MTGSEIGPERPEPNLPPKPNGEPMHNLTVYHPFAHNGFDELVRGFFRPVRVEKSAAPIKVDVVETDAAYVVKAEIPGVNKDEIQVSIEGDVVTIAAEVKREKVTNDGE